MAFTNTYDTSFPPDTQAANQLGQDIRSFKLDVMQRMAAISGNDASKPAFEAGFAGVLYFAPDTSKIYQWSGATWVDVTSSVIPVATQSTMVPVGFSANPTWDASTASRMRVVFEMTLTGDVTAGTTANLTAGQEVTFIIHQDGTGNHGFVWPGGVNNPGDISPTAGSTSTQTFVVANDGLNMYPVGPVMATA